MGATVFEGFAILDMGRLAEIVGDDEDFIAEILQLYLESSGADMRALSRAAAAGSVAEVGRLAHTLKGASGNIGANAMMEFASRIETLAKGQAMESLTDLVATGQTVFENTARQIKQRLSLQTGE